MKRFSCACGQPVFFDSTACVHCRGWLGFDPIRLELIPVYETSGGLWSDEAGINFKRCANWVEYDNCNWLVQAYDSDSYCLSCRLNRTIPDLTDSGNLERWRSAEAAKRRLIYSLLSIKLTVNSRVRGWPFGLAFDLVEDQRSNPDVMEEFVLTHHADGIITLNIHEADDVVRVGVRIMMNERYRTVLGHFRHESGHYYFQQLVTAGAVVADFRALFGDERNNYAAALERAYRDGPPDDWYLRYISAYAATHPAEDWAESWAHYLHILDGLETAASYQLTQPVTDDFDAALDEWSRFSVALNEVNRALGLADAYPFVISQPVADKLRFVHGVVKNAATC